jgi:hypothetical protein
MAPPGFRGTFCAPVAPRGHLPHRISTLHGSRCGSRAAQTGGQRCSVVTTRSGRGSKAGPLRGSRDGFTLQTERRASDTATRADVAQLVEQLTRNEQVVRSNRIVGSTIGVLVHGLSTAVAMLTMAAKLCWCRLVPSSRNFGESDGCWFVSSPRCRSPWIRLAAFSGDR